MEKPDRSRYQLWLGFVGLAFVIAFAGLLFYGVARLIQQFLAFLKDVDPQVAAQIIAASGTVIVTVATIVAGQLMAKNRETREAHREKKTKLYNGFLNMVKDLLQAGGSATPEEYVERIRSFNSELILYGSPDVIKAYHKWNTAAQTLGGANPAVILVVDELYRAFRKDLGLSNRSLGKGDLVQLYLKPGEMDRIKQSADA